MSTPSAPICIPALYHPNGRFIMSTPVSTEEEPVPLPPSPHPLSPPRPWVPFAKPFPDDILYEILQFVSRKELPVLARTRRDFAEILRPRLYQELVLGRLPGGEAPDNTTSSSAPGRSRPPHPTVTLLANSTLPASVRTLRIRPHPAAACPGKLVHLPNLEVLDMTLSDERPVVGLGLPPIMCFGWGCKACPLAVRQMPRTLIVRARTWMACDVWAARHDIFPPTVLSRVKKLIVITDVSHPRHHTFLRRPPYDPVEMVQILTLPRYSYRWRPEAGAPLTRLMRWWISLPGNAIPLTIVDRNAVLGAEWEPWEFEAAIRKAGKDVRALTLDQYLEEGEELEAAQVADLRELQREGRERMRARIQRASERGMMIPGWPYAMWTHGMW